MTEETTPQDAATEPSAEQQPTEAKPTETVEFWKQKAREQEKRAKDNATAASRLAEIENASKTEQQRATEALTNAEKRAAEAEGRALRLEVAAAKGLTPAQAKRLVGSNREELESDADDLLENFKPSNGDTETAPPARPALDLDLGARGTATAPTDKAALFTKFLNSTD